MMVSTTKRMHDAVGSSFDATAETVVLALVVVVAHISSDWLVDFDLVLVDSNVGFHRAATFVFDVVGWIDSFAVLSFGDVELGLVGLVVSLTAVVVNVDVVPGPLSIDFDVNVIRSVLRWCTGSVGKNVSVGQCWMREEGCQKWARTFHV